MTRAELHGVVLECVRGDVTAQPDLEAIVNAANAQLAPGGGVAGAIHRAAGAGLWEECRPLAPIATGDAVITAGHALPNEWVVHTLGPVYAESSDPRGELRSCYRRSLEVADERGVRSIGFPAVSTGIFGYPVDEAANVAMNAVAAQARTLRAVKLVRFVLFSERDLSAHAAALGRVAAGG